MPYDFDEVIDRSETDSLKYDFAIQRGKPADVLPLWVADMDFRTPQAVTEALIARARHGIFGYSEGREAYFSAVQGWYSHNFGWETKPEWLVKTPGVVYAVSAAVRALTKRGDSVLIQQPVYYPFTEAVASNARKLVVNQLVYEQGKYHIDFAGFERRIREYSVRLFILCSPHNPVGRVWTKDELTHMGEICRKYGVLVVSDEIHADFVYSGHSHTVFAGIDPRFLEFAMICTAPTKTFNLAGLQISNIFIANRELRRRFIEEVTKSGYSQPNTMGIVACRAAYEGGQEWLNALRVYLGQNLGFLRGFVRDKLPGVSLVEPEGTYLTWLDFHGTGLSGKQLDDLIVQKAGLWLDSGELFGAGGKGFQRINIACPRATLERALTQLERALKQGS